MKQLWLQINIDRDNSQSESSLNELQKHTSHSKLDLIDLMMNCFHIKSNFLIRFPSFRNDFLDDRDKIWFI